MGRVVPFSGANPIDTGERVDIPVNGAIVKGSTGGNAPTFARITVHPDNLAKLLPSGDEPELSETMLKALAVYRSIKGGHRAEYLKRYGVTDADVDMLVSDGYLKRNRAGATSITTLGKNAVGNRHRNI